MKKQQRVLALILSGFCIMAQAQIVGGNRALSRDLQQIRSLQESNRAASARNAARQPGAVSARAKKPKMTEALIDELAYHEMTREKLPMTPNQIVRLKRRLHETQRAAAATPGTPPKPVATSQLVNLAPGSTPPVIRLTQGFVSSIVFLDSSGATWPIANYDLGNPSAFNIVWDQKSATLMVQATKHYTYGNLAVRLKGLPTPVMITLVPGGTVVDYRVDLRVQGYGPNAKALPTTDGLPAVAESALMSVLEGVPPNGSRELRIEGGGAQVWLRGDKMFVRTRYTLLSPGYMTTMQSADGMHVYKLQSTPNLLMSQHGKVVPLKIEGL